MKKLIGLTAMVAVFLALVCETAIAEKGSLKVTNISETEIIVTNDKGEKEKKLVNTSKVSIVPGDVVIYTIVYENVSDKTADNITITDHVPGHMVYIGGSATGDDTEITFSIDKGKSYHRPEELMIKKLDNTERVALPEEYQSIRWLVKRSIKAGDKGSVRFKAKLE